MDAPASAIGRFVRDNPGEAAARLRAVLAEDPSRARVANAHDTPLMWLPDDEAVAREIAALLVHHGADPSICDARGLTAAELAAERGLDEVAALLRGDGA